MDAAILDTDCLSEVFKRKYQQILLHTRQYLAAHRCRNGLPQRFAATRHNVKAWGFEQENHHKKRG